MKAFLLTLALTALLIGTACAQRAPQFCTTVCGSGVCSTVCTGG